MRSAKLSQRSFAISEVSTVPPDRARATSLRSSSGHVDDIGIGKEEIIRRPSRRLGRFDALAVAPKAFRSTPPASVRPDKTVQAVGGAERRRRVARDLRGAIPALVVDHDHAECARIILAQQRRDGLRRRFRPRRARESRP